MKMKIMKKMKKMIMKKKKEMIIMSMKWNNSNEEIMSMIMIMKEK